MQNSIHSILTSKAVRSIFEGPYMSYPEDDAISMGVMTEDEVIAMSDEEHARAREMFVPGCEADGSPWVYSGPMRA